MCAVCVQWEKGKLTKIEAANALIELINTDAVDIKHVFEVHELIEETEE